ncbi:twin-arginine translocase subunit TatC [Epidermidibacterium keratini]|uniref:Sec-independent protein translocase protein TatC n=1 Tax=Epidermidibacterium keratini TaxID=1891644 RepID=A0A7L4YTE7_9ACTN|nr:twin-arginine translocase subunit TatC [Epidermidibacterium keratini]QHC02049.1 twin-arginine translocase subunit TatC [Epidermidibacterium keratini]
MTLIEHLRELRGRIIKALLGIAIGAVLGFIWYDYGLLEFLKQPYCSLPNELRYPSDDRCTLLFLDPAGGLLLRLKIAALTGVVISSPWWLYQLWAFITPGLHRNERRWAVSFVALSTTLFALGTICAWLTLNAGLRVLLTLAGDEVTAALTAPDYLSFVISLIVVFGVSFELPLIIVMLNLVGVLSYETLGKSRRWLYFLTFVFAALITPTQDPFSMLAMALPMVVLFEGAIQAARIHDKRAARRAAAEGYGDVPDDEPSHLDVTPSSIEQPYAVPAPDPVPLPTSDQRP